MQSLKVFIRDTLAEIIGKSPITIYERQAPMVSARLLDAKEGRGPGSGVEASPRSVAMMLVAVLATDNPSDVETVRTFAKLRNADGVTLHAALAAILSEDVTVTGVRVQRDQEQAMILDGRGRPILFSKPGRDPSVPPRERGLFVDVSLYRESLQSIADILGGNNAR